MTSVVIGLNAVIAAVTDEAPRVLTVTRSAGALHWEPIGTPPPSAQKSSHRGLPFGPLDPQKDRTLDLGLRRWVLEQTGIDLGYVEQLYTFGDRNRDPQFEQGGRRVLSVAYLALARESRPSGHGAAWLDWYRFFPWEDWRDGRPDIIPERILPALNDWLKSSADPALRLQRRERMEIVFGQGGAAWNWERVLDRYELLYEARLVAEALRQPSSTGLELRPGDDEHSLFGEPMILDHRRILATALDRLRGKLKYRPVVFELLPPTFTLLQLQRLVEALSGLRLHKQNFRRLVENGGLVEGTLEYHHGTGGRPAELFRFRREVLRERPAPGVGLPVA